jgi:Holliday junction resolvase
MSSKINSRAKGARAERAFRDLLREEGYSDAIRAQQFCGAAGDADIKCESLAGLHFEVKHVENLNVYDAMIQSRADAAKTGKTPVVAMKKNGKPWLIVQLASDWFSLVRNQATGTDVIDMALARSAAA